MRSKPSLPAVNVTIMFTGKMPTSVSVRRVDATHANALPAYEASKFSRKHVKRCSDVGSVCHLSDTVLAKLVH